MLVRTRSGRSDDLDLDDVGSKTAGHVADELADAVYGHDGQFSFKVNGEVLPRSAKLKAHLDDDAVIELIDVTDAPVVAATPSRPTGGDQHEGGDDDNQKGAGGDADQ